MLKNCLFRADEDQPEPNPFSSSSKDQTQKQTLMDYARSEMFQPKEKKVNLSGKISNYLDAFKNSKEEGKKFITEILSPGNHYHQ